MLDGGMVLLLCGNKKALPARGAPAPESTMNTAVLIDGAFLRKKFLQACAPLMKKPLPAWEGLFCSVRFYFRFYLSSAWRALTLSVCSQGKSGRPKWP